ncbi:MAG TPA: T9SS type A sorting domain-containing protein, partial [Flavitalea sp.]|nr:T9SS type A sorting domain-containing protein [Flavitalea sp.]
NTWTTITNNVRNQFGTTMASIIDIMGLQRWYGDLAIDGLGNMWMVISGNNDFGLFKITAPLPTTPVASLTARQMLAPTTPSPAGSFGGIAFNSTGQMLMSSNSPSNKLYRMNDDYTLTLLSNLAMDGIGNDLTSCNFPMGVLAASWVSFEANLRDASTVNLSWNIFESANVSGYTIEHSMNGTNWEQLAYIQKTGNDISRNYSWSQTNLLNGTHYYRIRKNEFNGNVAYSSIKKLSVSSGNSIMIWPNPAQDVLKVQDAATTNRNNELFIYDQSGRLASQTVLKPGVNSINIHSLPAGSYFVRIKNEYGGVTNQKFVKQ